jgi:hypothetical protein
MKIIILSAESSDRHTPKPTKIFTYVFNDVASCWHYVAMINK